MELSVKFVSADQISQELIMKPEVDRDTSLEWDDDDDDGEDIDDEDDDEEDDDDNDNLEIDGENDDIDQTFTYDPNKDLLIKSIDTQDSNKSPKYSNDKDSNRDIIKTLTLEKLRPFFFLPIATVAKDLGICTTALKKVCRKNNILKWPYRLLKSLTKSVQSLEMASLNDNFSDSLKDNYKEQIKILNATVNRIISDPNAEVVLDSIGLSEAIFKEFTDDFGIESSDIKEIIKKKRSSNDNNDDNYNINNNSNDENDLKKLKKLKTKKEKPLLLNPRYQPVDFDQTICTIDTNPENCKYLFSAPIQLALLQKKKSKYDIPRKIIPLVEPDIGSNYKTEFVPQFMLKLDLDHSNS